MTVSLIKFARSFEQLKIRLQAQPASDLRLILLVDYWPTLKQFHGISGYNNYFEEFVPLLLDHIIPKYLRDLLPEELTNLLDVTLALQGMESARDYGNVKDYIGVVASETARKFIFLGEIEKGLQCLTRAGGFKMPAIEIPEFDDQLQQGHALKEMFSQLEASGNRLTEQVRKIIREWEFVREAISFEEANCLFVEKNEHNDRLRGRLRSLTGFAEYRRKGAGADEVTFENRIKAPDDPFVGVVHDALKAVRVLFQKTGYGGHGERHIRARFGIAESDHAFTGDSIGLAAALVAYTQLLQPEILRHERFIAYEASFTGGVDAAGYLQPVNNDTLKTKIERAFISPARYLVLPRDNLEAARKFMMELQTDYPNRQLMLVGARTLAEVIDNRNIIRAEKVCAGQYIVRKARTFSRLAKVQVPILFVLLYVLLCLIYPKAWIGFDRNPELVWLNENRDQVLVFNRDSTLLWNSPVDCPPISYLKTVIYDLDDDGGNEVIYLQAAYESVACPKSDLLTVCGPGGRVLFTRKCSIYGEYPGDTASDQSYVAKTLHVFPTEVGPVLITNMVQSYPGRSHIKIWSAEGDLLGWYVHAGHALTFNVKDINNDGVSEILGFGINNPTVSNGLFVLPMHGAFGASPPYEDSAYDLSWVTHGNQLHYILFTTGDLNTVENVPYDCGGQIVILPGDNIRMDISRESQLNNAVWRSFYINEQFQVWKVATSDLYWNYRQGYVDNGRLPQMDKESFNQREFSRVRYWTDDGWISQAELESRQ